MGWKIDWPGTGNETGELSGLIFENTIISGGRTEHRLKHVETTWDRNDRVSCYHRSFGQPSSLALYKMQPHKQ